MKGNLFYMYSVSQKNTPDSLSFNLNKYFPIEIIFWHNYYLDFRQSKDVLFSHLA